VKLVNADPFEKTTKISLNNLGVDTTGRMITVTGNESLVHIPNVNKKNAEQVVPVEAEIKLDDNCAIITLSANSVNIIVLNLE
jgi:Holliday junction resolvasome RuvABC DNA-binding subunit